MKKTEEIIIPEHIVPAQTKKKEVIICDVCHEPENNSSTYRDVTRCMLCNRDIHKGSRNLKAKEPCSDTDPDDWGDYPGWLCKFCMALRWKKYAKEISDIEEEAFNRKEAVLERIKAESLAMKGGE